MRKLIIALALVILLLPLVTCGPPVSVPAAEKETPPPTPEKVTELIIETWEIGGNLMYSGQAIRDDIFTSMASELEQGKIVRQQIIRYDLRSREQKTLFELPADRIVYDSPSVYDDLVLWSSVSRIEEEQQHSLRRAPLPDFDVFLLDIKTGQMQQLTKEEHAQVSPRIYGDTIVWLDARNVEGYYNPQRYDVYSYDLKTKTEERLTSAPTAEGRDLSISGSMVIWTDDRHADPPMAIHAENERGFNNEIYAYDLSTNREKRITNYPGNDRHPVIDGDNIVWLRQLHQDYIKADVFIFNIETGCETQVSTSGYATFCPSIHGNRILYSDARVSLGNTDGDVIMNGIQGQADIYLYDLETKQEVKLSSTKPGDVLADPIVYRDYIVYTSVIMIGSRIYGIHLS
jgi:beta propeller repeat protein